MARHLLALGCAPVTGAAAVLVSVAPTTHPRFSLMSALFIFAGCAVKRAYALAAPSFSYAYKTLCALGATPASATAAKLLGAAVNLARKLTSGAQAYLLKTARTLLRLLSALRVAAYFLASLLAAWLLNSRSQAFFTRKAQAAVFYDFKLSQSQGGFGAAVAVGTATHTIVIQRVKSGARVSIVGAAKTYRLSVTTACLGGLLASLGMSSAYVRVVFYSAVAVSGVRTLRHDASGWALLTPVAKLYQSTFCDKSTAWLSKEDLSPEHRVIYERTKLDPTPEEVERSRRNFGTGQNLVDAIHEAEAIPGPVFRVLEAEHLAIPGMTRLRIPMPFTASPGSTTFHGLPWFLDFVHLT